MGLDIVHANPKTGLLTVLAGSGRRDPSNGLRDTAKGEAADASPGVQRQVDDGRMAQQIADADDLAVGGREPERWKRLHRSSLYVLWT